MIFQFLKHKPARQNKKKCIEFKNVINVRVSLSADPDLHDHQYGMHPGSAGQWSIYDLHVPKMAQCAIYRA